MVGTTTTATLSASAGGALRTATLTVAGLAVASLAVDPASVTGGTSVTGTVTLTNAALAGGFAVVLFSDNAAATPPAVDPRPCRRAGATFEIPTAAVASTTPANLYASGGGILVTTTLTVNAP